MNDHQRQISEEEFRQELDAFVKEGPQLAFEVKMARFSHLMDSHSRLTGMKPSKVPPNGLNLRKAPKTPKSVISRLVGGFALVFSTELPEPDSTNTLLPGNAMRTNPSRARTISALSIGILAFFLFIIGTGSLLSKFGVRTENNLLIGFAELILSYMVATRVGMAVLTGSLNGGVSKFGNLLMVRSAITVVALGALGTLGMILLNNIFYGHSSLRQLGIIVFYNAVILIGFLIAAKWRLFAGGQFDEAHMTSKREKTSRPDVTA